MHTENPDVLVQEMGYQGLKRILLMAEHFKIPVSFPTPPGVLNIYRQDKLEFFGFKSVQAFSIQDVSSQKCCREPAPATIVEFLTPVHGREATAEARLPGTLEVGYTEDQEVVSQLPLHSLAVP
jgi:hypothetical protein